MRFFNFLEDYIGGNLVLVTLPIRWPKFDGNAKASIGKISIFGPKEFVEQSVKAIREELARYDAVLMQEILAGKYSIHFYFQEGKHLFKYHSVAVFAIPEQIVRYKSEGICQFIVFRYFQTLELGKGLPVALMPREEYKAAMLRVKVKMLEWLDKSNYPVRWKAAYPLKTSE